VHAAHDVESRFETARDRAAHSRIEFAAQGCGADDRNLGMFRQRLVDGSHDGYLAAEPEDLLHRATHAKSSTATTWSPGMVMHAAVLARWC
jgi:hypothetical protein